MAGLDASRDPRGAARERRPRRPVGAAACLAIPTVLLCPPSPEGLLAVPAIPLAPPCHGTWSLVEDAVP